MIAHESIANGVRVIAVLLRMVFPYFRNPYGYIDKKGHLVVRKSINHSLHSFSDGLAIEQVWNRAKAFYRFIGRDGRTVIKGPFEEASRFSEGLAAVKPAATLTKEGDDHYGFINREGKYVIPPKYASARPFANGRAAVSNGKDWGFIDPTGRAVTDFVYDQVLDYSEGLAAVSYNHKVGYIDLHGQWAILPEYAAGASFSDGLALVNGSQYIDKTGRMVIRDIENIGFPHDPELQIPLANLPIYSENLAVVLRSEPGYPVYEGGTLGTFSQGLAAAKKGAKYGFIDKTGEFVIEPKFDCVYPFSDGMAVVSINGLFGYINSSGSIVISPKSKRAFLFSEGLAAVSMDMWHWNYVDKSGSQITRRTFCSPKPFSEGLAKVGERPRSL